VTRTGSLLVVDDNDANRDVLARLLRHRGYAVSVAADGAEALAVIETLPLDLVLLDVEMPGISGYEVLRRIRARRSQTELPVIMVTARSEGTDIVEAFRLGANDYVTKPVDFPVALARIGTHLSHKWVVEDLRDSEERYGLAVQGANDGLWDWNLVTNTVYWSARWKSMLGYEEPEIGATPEEWLSRVHPDDRDRVKEALAAHLANGGGHFESEHRLRHRNEMFRWVLCRGAAVRNGDGTATRLAGSLTDITETKLADALTGLPNRILFFDLVERAIKRSERRPSCVFALLVLGLDRFTVVQDSLGPVAADRLLVAVARRLQSSLRSTDAVARDEGDVTLARSGGDEFNVLLDDISDARDAIRVAERLRHALEQPFEVEGSQLFISATIGIAVSTTGYHQPEAMLRDATAALHRARSTGTNPYEIFDPTMRTHALSRLQGESDLRQATETSAFELHYQPIVALDSGRIAGFEALLRWRHPTRGLVSPAEFIPLAEDTGMIVGIGRFALSESCRQMAAWERQFGEAAPGVMCVNVCSRQLRDGLVDEIGDILARTGLAPSKLKLEITESVLINDAPAAHATMGRLQAMGIAWSLDDFGTGYSSLSYLHQFRVSTLKVDRSFVSQLGTDGKASELVRTIVALAHNLGMDVVAEGVETLDQLAHLQGLRCEYAQGFHFSRPVESAAADRLIAAGPWAVRGETALEDLVKIR
jgi:diguanylate cyclase (GGDEF)-like protein/PAS domain S-box-containing protein